LLAFLPLISIQVWNKNSHHPRIPAHHLSDHEGTFFIWGQYTLCHIGGDCLGSGCDHPALRWSLLSSRAPDHSLAIVEHSLWLRRASSSEIWKKASSPLQLIDRQPKRSGAGQGLLPDCQCYMGKAETSAHWSFSLNFWFSPFFFPK
jgi:hypothetical protein